MKPIFHLFFNPAVVLKKFKSTPAKHLDSHCYTDYSTYCVLNISIPFFLFFFSFLFVIQAILGEEGIEL